MILIIVVLFVHDHLTWTILHLLQVIICDWETWLMVASITVSLFVHGNSTWAIVLFVQMIKELYY